MKLVIKYVYVHAYIKYNKHIIMKFYKNKISNRIYICIYIKYI